MTETSPTPAELDPELRVESAGFVRILTLNRPERRNALSESLKYKIIHEFLSAQEDDSVRVIVLTGTGDSAFCSGADLKDMRQSDDQGIQFRSPMNRFERNIFEEVLESKKPTIAALNGSASNAFSVSPLTRAHMRGPFSLLSVPVPDT